MTNSFMLKTGIDWISEIPVSWTLRKAKYLFTQRQTKGNPKELQLLTPSQRFGVIPQSLYDELSGLRTVKLNEKTNLSLLKTVRPGDFCISLRSFQGGFEYSNYDGVVSPAYQIFYPTDDTVIFASFYKYLFKCNCFITKINSYTLSLRDGKNIAFKDFGNTYLPVPSLSEQSAIANFLDTKCAEIDALTADIEKQIETLQDYKQSVITEAVTKGLDPNVEMKDSGEWLGNIPLNWTVKSLNYLLKTPLQYGASESGEHDKDDSSYRYIRITDIDSEGFLKADNVLFLPNNLGVKYSLAKDDVLFARSGGTVGKTYIHKLNGLFCFAGYLIKARLNEAECIPEYFYLYTKSYAYDNWKNSIFSQATIPNISAEKLSKLKVCLPSVQTQREIVHFLNNKCDSIDQIILLKNKQLDTILKYRQSLIYEYVTGKKTVPHA